MVCKDNSTTFKVNLYILTLWSNQGNLKDPQANQGINLDRCTVLGGKPTLTNLLCNHNNLSFLSVQMLHSLGHLMVLPQVNLFNQDNLFTRVNLFNQGSPLSQVNLSNQANLHIQFTLLNSRFIL